MSVFDINKICRVCLEEGALVSIYSTEDAISPLDMIVSCTNIKITDNDELPSSLCEHCIRRLGVAFQFKQQCENSDMRLRECLGLDGPTLMVIEEKGDEIDDNINEKNNGINIDEHNSTVQGNNPIELQHCQKPMEQIVDNNINHTATIENPLNCNNLDVYNTSPVKFCNVSVSFGEVGTQVKDEEILAAMNAVCEMFDTTENSDVLLLSPVGNSCESRKEDSIISTENTNTTASTALVPSESNLDPLIDNPFLNQNSDEPLSIIDTHALDNIVGSNGNRHNSFDHINDVNNEGFTLELPEQLLKLPIKTVDFKEQLQPISSLGINELETINEIDQNMISTSYEIQANNFYNKISNGTQCNPFTTTHTTKINKATIKNRTNSKKQTKNVLNKSENCLDCGKTFSKSSYLEAHMRTHTGDRPYKCTMCHLQFAQTGNLALHMRVHTGEKPYQCKLCSKLFSKSSNLKAHQRIHSEERNYKCQQCDRAFKSMAELTSHVGTHTGVKNYSCELCGKAFYKISYLNLHFRTVHVGEKRHRCTECGKEFSNSSNLTCHFRTHTGEKPFKCQYCDARFNQSSAMVRHLRQHKPDGVTNKINETATGEQINYSSINNS